MAGTPTAPGMVNMDVDMSPASFPPLPVKTKRDRTPSPSKDAPDKTPRTCQDEHHTPDTYVKVSFLLRAVSGARVFNNPRKVSHALHLSDMGKYIIEGETRCLGNGSALIVAVWEHNLSKIPTLAEDTFHLGDWDVHCRRAERDCGDFHYARVGPLADDADLSEVRDHFVALDGGEVVDFTWIPAHHLPRTTTGKWIRLKVRGALPTKVSIFQLVFWPRPYLLPLLRCPGCQRIGHSINTCRSAVRCSRCSGPHPYKQGNKTCTRPFHCFQCQGAHGPRSAYCSHNRHAQQVYADMAQKDKPLHAINKHLRNLNAPNTQVPHTPHQFPPATHRRQHSPPVSASLGTASPTSPARSVPPGTSYSSVATGNRFSILQDPQDEDVIVVDNDLTSLPSSPSYPLRSRRRPRPKLAGCQAPPPTPTPSIPEEGLTHSTVEADVHQPHVSPCRQGLRTRRPSCQAAPPHPLPIIPTNHAAPPSAPTCPAAGPPSSPHTDDVLSRVFTLL